ncbi:Phospholipase/carboxylesterase [Piedraia hortae CBS 480.64]|uniref:Acyl-protein thioesterase 1 n=1 Tax=Piedraia hortae CBS 480.64 TaxID=1314780 RepID=A0A6A7BWS3_9PEZI|nr:Phospholipase/carboxylesterase [Piedraia hortae CBS 480.64]
MQKTTAAAIVVPALKRHTSTVIMVHGLGDSGAGWSSIATTWQRQKKFQETKFIFPNAPAIPITINMGMRMPGWYDITSFEDLADRSEDEEGIARSQKVFHDLIAGEVESGIASDRIVLGGFSQGGAMSLLAGITAPTKLAGIFGLSCYLLLPGKLQSMIPKDSPNKSTRIFMGHGDADAVVRYDWGKTTAEKLREWGWSVDFKTYKGLPHSATDEEIDDLAEYLENCIPPAGASL